jgi:hypothetical protein
MIFKGQHISKLRGLIPSSILVWKWSAVWDVSFTEVSHCEGRAYLSASASS